MEGLRADACAFSCCNLLLSYVEMAFSMRAEQAVMAGNAVQGSANHVAHVVSTLGRILVHGQT